MDRLDFITFAADARFRNAWLREPGISLYVRRSIFPAKHGDSELANMEADEPGNGALTRFLDLWEPHYRFYVENIFNERLSRYLARRGYTIIEPNFPPCMIGLERKP